VVYDRIVQLFGPNYREIEVTLIKIPEQDGSSSADVDALWQKRLESDRKRFARDDADAQTESPKEELWVRPFRFILQLLGLYQRGVENAHKMLLRKTTFSFPDLPSAFEGFHILHLSDLHFGEDSVFINELCALVKHTAPDLCVLTGDYSFTAHTPQRCVYRGIQRLLSTLTPLHGFVAVLGNNDRSETADMFREVGIHMLVNAGMAVCIEEGHDATASGDCIWLAGVDDFHRYRCASLKAATCDMPEGAFTILLAHSPEMIREAADRGIDLYLCGHTHAGQICFPWGPLFLNSRSSRKFGAGAWDYQKMQGYTSAGIGTSAVPVRFNCPPEATIIELRRD